MHKALLPYAFRMLSFSYSKNSSRLNIDSVGVGSRHASVRLRPYYASTLKNMEKNLNQTKDKGDTTEQLQNEKRIKKSLETRLELCNFDNSKV